MIIIEKKSNIVSVKRRHVNKTLLEYKQLNYKIYIEHYIAQIFYRFVKNTVFYSYFTILGLLRLTVTCLLISVTLFSVLKKTYGCVPVNFIVCFSWVFFPPNRRRLKWHRPITPINNTIINCQSVIYTDGVVIK